MNQGLNGGLNGCGWVCRQLNKYASVIAVLSLVVPGVAEIVAIVKVASYAIDNIGSSDQNKGGFASLPLTPQEEIIMNQFSDKLINFSKHIIIALDQTFSQVGVPYAFGVNKQLAKMCIAKEYFFINEKTGLSTNALQLRLQLINELFAPIQNVIKEQMGKLPIDGQKYVIANANDFGNLFQNDVNGQSYFCYQYPTTSNNTAPGVPPTFPTIPSNNAPTFPTIPSNSAPGANIVLPSNNGSIKYDAAIVQAENPANVLVVQPQTPQPSTVDKTFKYIGFGVLALTAFALLENRFFKKSKQ